MQMLQVRLADLKYNVQVEAIKMVTKIIFFAISIYSAAYITLPHTRVFARWFLYHVASYIHT